MKYLRLITKNLGRNKRRTVLTILSVSVSVFLLATMQAVIAALGGISNLTGGEYRVIVRRNTSIADSMPEAYGQKIGQVPGVVAACASNWFGGIYKEDKPRNTFAQFYVDTKALFDVQFEMQISPEEKAAFQQERTAAIAGKKLADKFGWKVGDVIDLKGAIYPLDPRLTLRGIYTGPAETNFYFHREYVEEALGRPGRIGQYRVRIDSPGNAARVMEEIDSMFKNSAAPTKTETEAAFAAGFISMLGNVKGLISGIGLIVVFTITLIGANTMAMSARERFTEVAVMKALGFRPGVILSLMLSESVLIALIGGVLAAVAAKVVYQFVGLGDVLALFLQNFKITSGTIALALGASALIGLVSGGIPAWNAARIRIVDGLRRVA
ncbi:MAG TPA: FtsX-like permease family protein [Blastocatellia bacterium]|nr:FtsX-like permease family protein [Blastocatellia bacterium]